jgi:hypothetical protein
MFEFLLETIGELILQALIEILAELGLHSVRAPFRRPPNPWLAAVGYAIFGAILGGVSLWIVPSVIVKGETLRVLNLLVTPIAVGFLMSLMGAWRRRQNQPLLRIDRFSYGYVFALSLGIVRFCFTT